MHYRLHCLREVWWGKSGRLGKAHFFKEVVVIHNSAAAVKTNRDVLMIQYMVALNNANTHMPKGLLLEH